MRHRKLIDILFLSLVLVVFLAPVYAADLAKSSKPASKIQNYTLNRDMAFVSVLGSRPDVKNLKGFQRAVLYNAQGAKVKEITFSKSDSVYSLDKMLQENVSKGPLIIRMYR
jgi:hypothetical protein